MTRLWLAGGLGRLAGLPELLAAEVDGPVLPLALSGPTAAVPADAGRVAGAGPGGRPCAATAGPRAGRLNLRRGDLAYTRDFEHLKGKVAAAGLGGRPLVLLLAVASQVVKIYALSRQEQAVDRALCDAEEKILKSASPTTRRPSRRCAAAACPAPSIPKTSAVDVVADLSHAAARGRAAPLRPDRHHRQEAPPAGHHRRGRAASTAW